MKLDMRVWQKFLAHPAVFSRPFADFLVESMAVDLDLYTDASQNFDLGCGGYCGKQWCFIGWDRAFMGGFQPSIAYLELYAVLVAVTLWIPQFKNSRVALFCDNEAAVNMINNTTSSCCKCMVLL